MQVQAEQLRNSLLNSVSHDLRTPLAAIAGTASGEGDEAQFRFDRLRIRKVLRHGHSRRERAGQPGKDEHASAGAFEDEPGELPERRNVEDVDRGDFNRDIGAARSRGEAERHAPFLPQEVLFLGGVFRAAGAGVVAGFVALSFSRW